MPNPYLGVSTNVAFPTASSITGASNTNPIVVTISGTLPSQMTAVAAAGGSPTFPVDIQGVQGNTAANGEFQATATGTNTFSIPVAGNGAYTSGGSVTWRFPQSFNQPSDGDNRNSASVNVPLDALGDRTLAGEVTTGAWRLVKIYTAGTSSDSNTLWAQQTSVTNSWTLPVVLPGWEVTGVNSGDFVEVSLACTGSSSGSGVSLSLFSILASFQVPGGSTLYTKFGTSNQGVIPSSSAIFPLNLRGFTTISSTLSGFNIFFSPGFYAIGAAASFSLQGDYTFTCHVWRPTSVPQ